MPGEPLADGVRRVLVGKQELDGGEARIRGGARSGRGTATR